MKLPALWLEPGEGERESHVEKTKLAVSGGVGGNLFETEKIWFIHCVHLSASLQY
jgi:hypothetical protein